MNQRDIKYCDHRTVSTSKQIITKVSTKKKNGRMNG